jgi:hypothetical protein
MTNPRAREIFLEWEEIARGAVAHLRAANADNLHDPELQALVAELREHSALFEEWWSEHIVERRRTSIKHIRATDGDTIARRYEVLHLPELVLEPFGGEVAFLLGYPFLQTLVRVDSKFRHSRIISQDTKVRQT